MKILVVYDSVSPNRNTEKIANAMSEFLKEKNHDVTCPHVSSFDPTTMRNYDCVLVGSPTMAWTATDPIKTFLAGFKANEFAGKSAAAFDTRIKSRLSGQASKGIQEKLGKLGYKIITPPLISYVEGNVRENDFVLKDGELEKAKKYAEDLAQTLQL